MSNIGIKILGAGKYLPQVEITNEQLSQLVETNDEWITQRVGIKTRHAASFESNTYMGTKAAEQAIKNAGVSPDEIGIVFVSTITPDYFTPSTACIIANAVGIHSAVCMDISAACSGFVYAIDLARKYLMDKNTRYALVISTEMLTKVTDYTDRATCVLFGDGAGACVLELSDGFYSSFMSSDTTGASKIFARIASHSNPFMKEPYDASSDGFGEGNHGALWQDGQEVYKFATRTMPMAVEKACEQAGITTDDLACVFSHQANKRIIQTAAKNLGLPIEKFYINIEKHGNMSSACIPICLSEAMEEGRVKQGDKVCIVGFGAGLTYGATVFEW